MTCMECHLTCFFLKKRNIILNTKVFSLIQNKQRFMSYKIDVIGCNEVLIDGRKWLLKKDTIKNIYKKLNDESNHIFDIKSVNIHIEDINETRKLYVQNIVSNKDKISENNELILNCIDDSLLLSVCFSCNLIYKWACQDEDPKLKIILSIMNEAKLQDMEFEELIILNQAIQEMNVLIENYKDIAFKKRREVIENNFEILVKLYK